MARFQYAGDDGRYYPTQPFGRPVTPGDVVESTAAPDFRWTSVAANTPVTLPAATGLPSPSYPAAGTVLTADGQGGTSFQPGGSGGGLDPALAAATYAPIATTLTKAAAALAYGARWQAGTAYAVNDVVTNPGGELVICQTAHTSGSQYAASPWALSSSDRIAVQLATQKPGAHYYVYTTTAAAAYYTSVSRLRPTEPRRKTLRIRNLGVNAFQLAYGTGGNNDYNSPAAGNWNILVGPGQEYVEPPDRLGPLFLRANVSAQALLTGIYVELGSN